MVDKGESRRICSDRDEKGEDKQSRIGKVKHSTHRTKHNHRSKRTPSSSELSSPLDYRDRGRSRSSSYGKRRDLTPRRGSKTRDWSRSCESRRRVRLSRRSHEDNRHRSPARISHTKRYRYHHEDERYDSARRRRSTSASCDSYEYKRGRRYHPMDVRSRRRSNSPRSFSSYSGSSPLTSLSSASRSRVHSSLSTNDSKGRHPVSSRGRRRGSRSSSQDSRAKYKNPRPRKARLSRDSEEKVEESRAAASSINRWNASQTTASEYERSKRTIFVSQLALTISTKDLHKFFEQAGRVHNARIISDRNSHRSKGVGYVEFYEEESVPRALSMSGRLLHGQQIVALRIDAERISNAAPVISQSKPDILTKRLYVGHLDPSVTEETLTSLFGAFGPLEQVNLHVDSITGLSSGFAFIKFRNHADSKLAIERLNGYNLNGLTIKVTPTVDRHGYSSYGDSFDDKDSEGFTMNSLSRIDLMAKLARNKIPLGINDRAKSEMLYSRNILLKNMFNDQIKTEDNWSDELKDDVRSECLKYGELLHIGIDNNSTEGCVYLKFDTISEAVKAQKALNGRFFARCKITASFIPDSVYNLVFPESAYL